MIIAADGCSAGDLPAFFAQMDIPLAKEYFTAWQRPYWKYESRADLRAV
jgi:hypothetical protein